VRVAIQPDEKYLWVGNDSKVPAESGVTVIDRESLERVAQIETGAGHHEIAFSDDSRTAFVSNRKGGTVTVIDVRTLEKVKDIETGALPISIAFSSLSRSLYVADGLEGAITVIDAESHMVTARIKALPGLGPLRFDPSGRWGLVPNSEQDLVHVIDASVNRIARNVSVGTRPFQVAFSRAFAYVRSLGTERVSMFSLEDLNKGRTPPVVSFQAGQKAPELTRELNLADVIVEAPGEAAVLVTSPADATIYFYMEGMNAPMGNFRNYGHRPLAVGVVDRALREKSSGVYSANVRLPVAGTYEIAFLMQSPQILHCFSVLARPNPALESDVARLAVEYLVEDRQVPAGQELALRFRMTDPRTGELRRGLKDVRVLSYRAPAFDRSEVWATEVGDGLYEAPIPMRRPGAYYVFVSSHSAKATYHDLSYLTLMGVRNKAATQTTGQTGG
jgi:YVTN family beta-propeller protein